MYAVMIHFSCNLNISLLQGLHPSHCGSSTSGSYPLTIQPAIHHSINSRSPSRSLKPFYTFIGGWRHSSNPTQAGGKNQELGIHRLSFSVRWLLHCRPLSRQLTVVNATSQGHHQKIVSHILTRLQAFVIFMAILVSSDATAKEEATGLAAHSVLIMQLSKDLSGLQVWPRLLWVVYC